MGNARPTLHAAPLSVPSARSAQRRGGWVGSDTMTRGQVSSSLWLCASIAAQAHQRVHNSTSCTFSGHPHALRARTCSNKVWLFLAAGAAGSSGISREHRPLGSPPGNPRGYRPPGIQGGTAPREAPWGIQGGTGADKTCTPSEARSALVLVCCVPRGWAKQPSGSHLVGPKMSL